MKVGVFDSGAGGVSVANAIRQALPEHEVVYAEDRENLPYGNKTPSELLALVTPILKKMTDEGCQVIVVACNSVTTNIIDRLREEISVPLVGVEPMIKPAAELTKTGVIAVCATPSTLASHRYDYLKKTFAEGITVLEPDCSDWASLIEGKSLDHSHLRETVESCLAKNADVFVMGCTHYHWIEEDIEKIVDGKATVLQPEKPVIQQLRTVISQLQ